MQKYSLEDIVGLNSKSSKILPVETSNNAFSIWYLDSLHVLSNQKSVIGFVKKGQAFFDSVFLLVKENTTTKKQVFYVGHRELRCFKVLERKNLVFCESKEAGIAFFNLESGLFIKRLESLFRNVYSIESHCNSLYWFSNQQVMKLDLCSLEQESICPILFDNSNVCCIRMFTSCKGCKKLVFIFNNEGLVCMIDDE